MLVLEDELLDNIIAYDLKSNYDIELVSQIFKYFQPCITSEWQLENLDFLDDEILRKLSNTPLINRIEENLNSFDELVKESILKLMLVTVKEPRKNFKQIDITNDGMKTVFSQTYKKNNSREDIKQHIKALLSNKTKIIIKDKYLFKKWSENSKVLKEILPENKTLEVFVDSDEMGIYSNDSAKQALKNVLPTMTIEDIQEYEKNKFHDRYIIAENLEIILSSGFLYLENRSKDLTYIIRIKNES